MCYINMIQCGGGGSYSLAQNSSVLMIFDLACPSNSAWPSPWWVGQLVYW